MNNDDLFIACVNGDRKAQGFLYKKYQGLLFSICMKYIKDEDNAMDCLQDGFMHIFKKLSAMSPNAVVNLDGWLRVVMRNYCLDVVRKKKKDICFENIEYFTSEIITDEEFIPLISHNILLNLVETLSPQFKKVFTLYAMDELEHKQIAKELGISVNTSKTNYHRARKILKKRISELKLTN
jgi:RNA polymerase sigma-70 factor (ECF subfamily)